MIDTCKLRTIAVLFLALCIAPAAWAGEAFYLTIFAWESVPYSPKNTHTFATVTRIEGEIIENHTISWLPVSLRIDPVKLNSEPGFNPDYKQTIEEGKKRGLHISAWGPYSIEKGLFERFVALKAYLDSGAVTYHVASTGHPRPYAWDCAHALERLTTDRHRYIGPFGFGEPASARIVANLSPWMIEPERTHEWVAQRMGLGDEPLTWRDFNYRPTRRDSIRRALGR